MIRRRFVLCGGRRVHLWNGGCGSAVLLIHGSPGNASLVKPLAERLSRDHCIYAVDSPGFGGSDALPGETLQVAQLADAYRDLLDSIGLANVLVYGTHTGAAIGLELARRHPSRVSGFVLEGVPAFTVEEQRPLLAPDYLVHFEPDELGGHYTRTWTRFHDQFVWFPWYQRVPERLLEASAGSAADIHLWVEMYFQAVRHDYRPAYRAAIRYGTAALAAAGEVTVPGVFVAERGDMLFSHLERLPPLSRGQRIERIPGPQAVLPAIESALRSVPPSAPGVSLSNVAEGLRESFHDLPNGQLLVRSAGSPAAIPVLLLHDAPGAGRPLSDLSSALAAYSQVILPDLPGCGESDPLSPDPPALAEFADKIADLLTTRTGAAVDVYGVGFGAAVALELNARHPERVRSLLLTGVLRTQGPERRAMIGRLAPPIALAEDGSHWYRTWLMLRDSCVRWPWYSREPSALRRQALALDPGELHYWTCDVVRQWSSYHHLVDAVLGWNPAAALGAARAKLTVVVDSLHPLHASDVAWTATDALRSVTLPEDVAGRARVLLEHFSLTPPALPTRKPVTE